MKYEKNKDLIIESYKKTGSVWKTADELKEHDLKAQQIHRYLTKWGAQKKLNRFTKEEELILIAEYGFYKSIGKLELLAERLGRTKPSIYKRAKILGLTDNKGVFYGNKEKLSKFMKEWQAKNGHPKGMKGKKHTDETKKTISKKSKTTWSNPDHYLNSEEHKQFLSDKMTKYQFNNKNKSNNYSRTKKGWLELDGKKYYLRSSWEFEYAYYLDYLKKQGEIKEWEYEVDTFWFENIKRGVRSYTPDFKITNNDDSIEYHEVKGWLDAKSKTKLKRIAKYYPEVKLELIDEKRYKSIIAKKYLWK